MFDPELYRDKAAVEEWRKRGPIHSLTNRLKAQGQLTEAEFLSIDAEAANEVEQAIAFAETGTWETVQELIRHVYASPTERPS